MHKSIDLCMTMIEHTINPRVPPIKVIINSMAWCHKASPRECPSIMNCSQFNAIVDTHQQSTVNGYHDNVPSTTYLMVVRLSS